MLISLERLLVHAIKITTFCTYFIHSDYVLEGK